ncbi:MAG: galactose mutarotase [Chitinophagaceae bacterium]|nr:galactose mutarotase [Chitinophagaceae bacterium]
MKKSITKKHFGNFENKDVTAYTISNETGMQVTVINYGATITQIITPDKEGVDGNVILGFDTLDGYIQNGHQFHGCAVGRYANRIANAAFILDGTTYPLKSNHQNFCLHGGIKGFDKVWWNIEELDDSSLKLTYLSKDGEEGFPGNVNIELIYKLSSDNELIMDYTANTDKPTPVNLTNHCYFNLSAGKEPTILNHELSIFANQYTEADENLVPTGQLLFLENTPMDFRHAKTVGKDIKLAGGYDHNMILNSNNGKAAELFDPVSGRFMEMFTTEPAVQLYSGNALHFDNESNNIRSSFIQYAGLCLEAQHYPNSPNEPSFPNTILRPGKAYRQTTSYKFSNR